ncbi:MAG: heme ABC transporter permease, partial [Gammaproteobacteria bacterium]|nr:heme ABC transporter permease [Gammaproteobacteria bacterium]
MDWTWFHKWGSPKWFYELSGKWLPWLVGAMVTCLLIGVTWSLLFVPQDYQQGLTNRIFYVHVPVASISLAFFPRSIWGVDTWGTWWVWDGRLTSLLLQFFLLLGVVSLRTALEDSEGAARACALLSIVGCINVVVIKYSVDWWNTLHQPSTNFTLATDQANGPEIW